MAHTINETPSRLKVNKFVTNILHALNQSLKELTSESVMYI